MGVQAQHYTLKQVVPVQQAGQQNNMRHFPNRQTKKWLTSFKGSFFGDIIRSFNIDLFTKPGLIKIGKKLFPHTIGFKPPTDFTTAKINDWEAYTSKTWGISEDGIYSSENNAEFELDSSDGFSDTEVTNGDIMSVRDESALDDEDNEGYQVVQLSIGNTEGSFQITGGSETVKWAQSFTQVGGPLNQVTIFASKMNVPLDNLVVSIQEDDAGLPDGTDLVSIEIPYYQLTTTLAQIILKIEDFTPTSLELDLNKKYWIVFERSGVADLDKYFKVSLNQSTTDPYERGELLGYNGTTWTRKQIYRRVETFTASGNWTVPTGVTEALVECWGAGGGGKTNTGAGGGGAYANKIVVTNPTDVKAVVVGTGAADTNGGNSTFDSTVVVAAGGKSRTNGGAGGATADCTGDIKYAGGGGSTGTGNRCGGGGAGDLDSGGEGADTFYGSGGLSNGGLGGLDVGFMPAGGGGSTAGNQFAGARGEVKISYDVAATVGFPFVRERRGFKSISPLDKNIFLAKEILPRELLIVVVSVMGESPGTPSSVTIDGFTKLGEKSSTFGYSTQAVFYRIADGSEIKSISSGAGAAQQTMTPIRNYTSVCYRIANAGIPTMTQVGGSSGANFNPPSHSTTKSQKYLWLAVGSLFAGTTFDISAPPADYENFFVQCEGGIANAAGSPSFNDIGAKTASAERLREIAVEDPGAFTSASGAWQVAATIAIPPADPDVTYYQDASVAIETKFPTAEERLYITTNTDVKFLHEEDEKWQSLWQGIYQQDALDENYPHPMKNLGAGDTLIVGDGNKVHIMAAKGIVSTDLQANKLILPFTHYNNWIVVTKSSIFLGFRHKESAYLPSLIVYYEPYSEHTRTYEIKEGETVGFFDGENCKILDKSGQLRHYTGSAFETYDYFPSYFDSKKVDVLPHRNGIASKDGIVSFLWEGQGEYPAGIWEYNDGRLYHKSSLVYSKTDLSSYGAIESEGDFGALYMSDKVYIGGTVADDTLTKVEGIFTDTKNIDITVADDTEGYIETSRTTSQGVDNTWHRAYIKGDNDKLRYRTSETESVKYTGTWTTGNRFTAGGSFTTAVDNNIIKVGDEVIIRKGAGAGLTTVITEISGTTTKTVTVKESLTTSGDFEFNVIPWIELTNDSIIGDTTEWIQLKTSLNDNIEELQIGFTENRNIEE